MDDLCDGFGLFQCDDEDARTVSCTLYVAASCELCHVLVGRSATIVHRSMVGLVKPLRALDTTA